MNQPKPNTERRTDSIWDRLKKPGQTDVQLEQEIKEAKIEWDGQLMVKRALEAKGVKYDPLKHGNLDLDWGMHYA